MRLARVGHPSGIRLASVWHASGGLPFQYCIHPRLECEDVAAFQKLGEDVFRPGLPMSMFQHHDVGTILRRHVEQWRKGLILDPLHINFQH